MNCRVWRKAALPELELVIFRAVGVCLCGLQGIKRLHFGLIGIPASLRISMFAEFLLGAGKIVLSCLQMYRRSFGRAGLLGS